MTTHPSTIKPSQLTKPISNLIRTAGEFGQFFDKPGDQEHLNETLANIRGLRKRLEAAHTALNRAGRSKAHCDFVSQLSDDLVDIEQQIVIQMLVAMKLQEAKG